MIIAWVWQALIVGALVSGAALGLDGLLRLAGRPARWAWVGALGITVALIAIAPLRAPSAHALPPGASMAPLTMSQPLAPIATARGWSLSSWVANSRAYLSNADHLLDRPLGLVEHRAPTLGRWMLLLWGASALALLGLLCAVEWRFRRARSTWPLAELHGVRVRVAPDAGPAVIGMRHPEIIVPRWLLARDPSAQRLVIAHEREHVRSGDPGLLAAGWLAVVLLPWHPAVWWMASRLRLAVEMDCDMRLLRQGVAPKLYGTMLIDLGAECSGLGAGAPAFSDRPTQLERRIDAMMPPRRTVRRFARTRGSVLAALAAAAIVAACEARMPTAADVQQMDAASAVYAARQLGVADFKKVQYVVDDQPVSTDSAAKVRADDLAKIVLTCSLDSVNGPDVVRVGVPPTEIKKAAAGCPGRTLVALITKDHADSLLQRRDKAALDFLDVKVRTTDLRDTATEVALARVVPDGAKPVTRRIAAPSQAGAGQDSVAKTGIGGPSWYKDGVRVPNGFALHDLDGMNIASMEVIKGAAATKLYPNDPNAVHGVILITSKR